MYAIGTSDTFYDKIPGPDGVLASVAELRVCRPTTGNVTNTGNRRPGATGNRLPGGTGPAEDNACKTEITVRYTEPAESDPIGPIVLGRGANGTQISLYPGTLKVSAAVYVCDGVTGAELDGVAYRGEATVAYTGVGAMSIIVYAVDVRTVLDLDPFVQNFAHAVTLAP